MRLFYFLKKKELTEIKELKMQLEHYKSIINIENEIENQKKILENLIRSKKSEIKTITDNFNKLDTDYKAALETYTKLRKEISIFENKLDIIEFGIYEPLYNYDKSAEYRAELKKIIDLQKQMIRSETAVICSSKGKIYGSEAKGLARTRRARTKRYIKLTLRAFNGECDSLISKVKWNNINQIKERIVKSFETINKIGEGQTVTIHIDYLDLKIKELVLECEYQQKKQQEKEELRAAQEELRDDERTRRKFEQTQKEVEKEENKYQKALEKARKEAESSTGEKKDKLLRQITQLEEELKEAQVRKNRAISMAQQTKPKIEQTIKETGLDTEIIKLPESMEYKETIEILEKFKNQREQETINEIIAEEFPMSLLN